MLNADTKIYVRTEANPDAMTVDYHCAWDQGEHPWMISPYAGGRRPDRAEQAGFGVLWNNCRHPFYDDNPFPDTAAGA